MSFNNTNATVNPLTAHTNALANQKQTATHNALRTTPFLHTAAGTPGYVLPQGQSGLLNSGLPIQQGLNNGLPLQQQGFPLQQQGFPLQQQGFPLQQQGLPLQQGSGSNLLTHGVLPIQQGLVNNGLPLQQGLQQGLPLQQNAGFTSAPVVNPKLRCTSNLHTAPGTQGFILPAAQQGFIQQPLVQQQFIQQPLVQQQYIQQPILQQRELVQQQIPVETIMRPTIIEETSRAERVIEVQPIIHREVDAPEVHVVEQHIYEREALAGPTTITKQAIVEETVRPHIIEEVQNIVHREVPQTFVERVEQHVTEHITQPTVTSKQVINQQGTPFVAAGGAPLAGNVPLNNNRVL